MAWTDTAAALGAEAATAGLKAAKKGMGKRKYKRLVATAVAQMLQLLPGVGKRKARRRARQATGARPSKKMVKVVKGLGWKEGAEGIATAVGAAGVAKVVGTVTGKVKEKLERTGTARAAAGRRRRRSGPSAEPPPSEP